MVKIMNLIWSIIIAVVIFFVTFTLVGGWDASYQRGVIAGLLASILFVLIMIYDKL